MGPKKKDKKEKKGKKEKEKPAKILKSEYLGKIAERNALLAAAKKRIQKVENVYFAAEKRHEETQEDMADIIKYLEYEIEENELEIATFDEKIAAHKKELNKNDNYYEAIFATMEQEYEDANGDHAARNCGHLKKCSKKITLVISLDGNKNKIRPLNCFVSKEKEKALHYQIQQNAAKLSAFEEVRQQREEYLKKKEEVYLKIQEMEAHQHQEIYKAEKEAIIKQDTMQKEMECNLTKLATDFSQATDIAIGETTNKLIRDNIRLGNMLTCTQEIFKNARDSYYKMFKLEKQYRYNAELLDEEHRSVLQRYTKQVNSIETLIKSHEELYERIKMCERLIKDNRRLQRQIAEKECILKDKISELDDLLKMLNENENVFNSIKNAFNLLRRNVVNLEVCLYEAAKKVKHGIDIENITRIIDENAEDVPLEMNKEEQEENLKEYKYKIREITIEDVIEILGSELLSETEMQLLPALSSDFHLSGNHESTMSNIGLVKSNDINTNRAA